MGISISISSRLVVMSGHDGWQSFLKGVGGAFNFTYGGEKTVVPIATPPPPAVAAPPVSSAPPAPPLSTSSIGRGIALKSHSNSRLNTIRALRGGKRRGVKK